MEKIYCPSRAWDCPYYTEKGICTCENAIEECEDAALAYNDEDAIEFGLL